MPGCNSASFDKAFLDRQGLPSHAHFHNPARSCLCRFRLALQRKSGPRIALLAHTGLLRRPARCSVITQRARMQQRHSSTTASVRFRMCGLVICGSSAGQSRRKHGLSYPGREPRGCLHAGGEKIGHLAAPAPGRQTKWGECREGPLVSNIGSFSHGRTAQALGAQGFIA
jgi:hypothetical protein